MSAGELADDRRLATIVGSGARNSWARPGRSMPFRLTGSGGSARRLRRYKGEPCLYPRRGRQAPDRFRHQACLTSQKLVKKISIFAGIIGDTRLWYGHTMNRCSLLESLLHPQGGIRYFSGRRRLTAVTFRCCTASVSIAAGAMDELHSLMTQPTAFGFTARPNNGISGLGGFVLCPRGGRRSGNPHRRGLQAVSAAGPRLAADAGSAPRRRKAAAPRPCSSRSTTGNAAAHRPLSQAGLPRGRRTQGLLFDLDNGKQIHRACHAARSPLTHGRTTLEHFRFLRVTELL